MGERNSTAGQKKKKKQPSQHSVTPFHVLQLFRFLLRCLWYQSNQTPSYSLDRGFLIGLRICKDLLKENGPGFLDFESYERKIIMVTMGLTTLIGDSRLTYTNTIRRLTSL